MRSLLTVAFLFVAASAGHAQSFSFNIGGQPIHIAIRGGCADPSCISVNVPGYVHYGAQHNYGTPYGERRPSRTARATQKRLPEIAMLRDLPPAVSAPGRTAPAPGAAVEPAPTAPQPKPGTASAPLPAVTTAPAVAPPSATPPAPEAVMQVPAQTAPTAPLAATPTPEPVASPPANQPLADKKSPTVIAALPPATQDIEPRPGPAFAVPVGVWSSAEGQMRVEQCGKDLCSYAVGGKHAGKMILVHMRQTRDNRWSGQVNDVRRGQTFSASMSMRGANSLHIQGCALGGLVCEGHTLSRAH